MHMSQSWSATDCGLSFRWYGNHDTWCEFVSISQRFCVASCRCRFYSHVYGDSEFTTAFNVSNITHGLNRLSGYFISDRRRKPRIVGSSIRSPSKRNTLEHMEMADLCLRPSETDLRLLPARHLKCIHRHSSMVLRRHRPYRATQAVPPVRKTAAHRNLDLATLQTPTWLPMATRTRFLNQPNTRIGQRQSIRMMPTQKTPMRSALPNMRYWKCPMLAAGGGRPGNPMEIQVLLHRIIWSCCDLDGASLCNAFFLLFLVFSWSSPFCCEKNYLWYPSSSITRRESGLRSHVTSWWLFLTCFNNPWSVLSFRFVKRMFGYRSLCLSFFERASARWYIMRITFICHVPDIAHYLLRCFFHVGLEWLSFSWVYEPNALFQL